MMNTGTGAASDAASGMRSSPEGGDEINRTTTQELRALQSRLLDRKAKAKRWSQEAMTESVRYWWKGALSTLDLVLEPLDAFLERAEGEGAQEKGEENMISQRPQDLECARELVSQILDKLRKEPGVSVLGIRTSRVIAEARWDGFDPHRLTVTVDFPYWPAEEAAEKAKEVLRSCWEDRG